MTAFSLMEEMGAALSKQDSFTADVTGGLDLGAASHGITLEVGMDFAMGVEMLRDKGLFHADGTAAVSMLGMDAEMPLELYGRMEEPLTLYLRVLDAWVKQSTELRGVSLGDITISDWENLRELTDNANLREETEEINGRTAYRIDMTLPGALLRSTAGLLGPESGSEADDLDWDSVTLNTVFWIDAETRLPIRQSLWLEGTLSGGSLRLTRLQAQIDYTGFGTVGDIVIPPEALNAPAADSLLDSLI